MNARTTINERHLRRAAKNRCRDCNREIEPACEWQVRCYICIGKGCGVERTVLSRKGTLDMRTGTHTADRAVWETGPCGSPLWSLVERESGVCKGCRDGWVHPENFPTRHGERQIEAQRGAA